MGHVYVDIGVSDGNGGAVKKVERVLVDTGATYTVLPASLLRSLNIQPQGTRRFTFGDGRQADLPVGEARFFVEGLQSYSPVVFGADGRYLLGTMSLQALGLVADTTNHRLVPATLLL